MSKKTAVLRGVMPHSLAVRVLLPTKLQDVTSKMTVILMFAIVRTQYGLQNYFSKQFIFRMSLKLARNTY
jgi:hypothetical protein